MRVLSSVKWMANNSMWSCQSSTRELIACSLNLDLELCRGYSHHRNEYYFLLIKSFSEGGRRKSLWFTLFTKMALSTILATNLVAVLIHDMTWGSTGTGWLCQTICVFLVHDSSNQGIIKYFRGCLYIPVCRSFHKCLNGPCWKSRVGWQILDTLTRGGVHLNASRGGWRGARHSLESVIPMRTLSRLWSNKRRSSQMCEKARVPCLDFPSLHQNRHRCHYWCWAAHIFLFSFDLSGFCAQSFQPDWPRCTFSRCSHSQRNSGIFLLL